MLGIPFFTRQRIRRAALGMGLLVLGLNSQAFAWNELGHEAIAVVAYSRLREDERHKLNEIAAACPEIYGGKQGVEALEYGSIWPDILRDGHEFGSHQDEILTIFTAAGVQDSNQKAADNLHVAMFTADGQATDPKGNVAAAVKMAYAALSNPNSNRRQMGEALAWLAYAVGDAHEPMQCGRSDDWNGKAILIAGLGKKKADTELHAVWEDALLRSTRIKNPIDYAKKHLVVWMPQIESTAIADLDPESWVLQSHQVSLLAAYVDDLGMPLKSGAKLSEAYLRRSLTIVDEQLAFAGLRLGEMLKYALDVQ